LVWSLSGGIDIFAAMDLNLVRENERRLIRLDQIPANFEAFKKAVAQRLDNSVRPRLLWSFKFHRFTLCLHRVLSPFLMNNLFPHDKYS